MPRLLVFIQFTRLAFIGLRTAVFAAQPEKVGAEPVRKRCIRRLLNGTRRGRNGPPRIAMEIVKPSKLALIFAAKRRHRLHFR